MATKMNSGKPPAIVLKHFFSIGLVLREARDLSCAIVKAFAFPDYRPGWEPCGLARERPQALLFSSSWATRRRRKTDALGAARRRCAPLSPYRARRPWSDGHGASEGGHSICRCKCRRGRTLRGVIRSACAPAMAGFFRCRISARTAASTPSGKCASRSAQTRRSRSIRFRLAGRSMRPSPRPANPIPACRTRTNSSSLTNRPAPAARGPKLGRDARRRRSEIWTPFGRGPGLRRCGRADVAPHTGFELEARRR